MIATYQWILTNELYQIGWLQDTLEQFENILSLISIYTHPKIFFLYFIPIFAAFNLKFYVKILIAAISSNFIMNLSKWIIAEGRPFWWMHESNVFTDLTRPIIRQTQITCETSAGCPSGHVMFQAAILYVIAANLSNRFTDKLYGKGLIWIIYILALAFVSISRMYFACHFLHQCIFGAIFGYILSKYFVTNERFFEAVLHASKRLMFGIGMIMGLSVVLLYIIQIVLGKDPQWSIRLAFKWCENPYYLNPDTTPIFALIQVLGLAFGLICSSPLSEKVKQKLDPKLSFPVVTALIFLYGALIGYIPRQHGVLVFYLFNFFINFFFIFITIFILPKLCKTKNN